MHNYSVCESSKLSPMHIHKQSKGLFLLLFLKYFKSHCLIYNCYQTDFLWSFLLADIYLAWCNFCQMTSVRHISFCFAVYNSTGTLNFHNFFLLHARIQMSKCNKRPLGNFFWVIFFHFIYSYYIISFIMLEIFWCSALEFNCIVIIPPGCLKSLMRKMNKSKSVSGISSSMWKNSSKCQEAE